MTIQQPNSIKIFDPDPVIWLTESRLKQLERDLLSSRYTLALGGGLVTALRDWLRQQLALEAPWSDEERSKIISERKKKWKNKLNLEDLGLSNIELGVALCVDPGCEAWAAHQWNHRLESLFLKHKSELDCASCRLLRVSDKGLAIELYHQIKSKENSFDVLSFRYGMAPEKNNGGLIPLQQLSKLPYGLDKILPKLSPGEVLRPQRLGEHLALVQLETWQPAVFNEASKRMLLTAELEKWLEAAGKIVLAHLKCAHSIEVVAS